MKKLIIATRGSKLALWQSNHIKDILKAQNPDIDISLKTIVTTGDKIINKPLSAIGGKGLFLKELEEAMQRGEAHLAVHSLKDVPTVLPDGFSLGAITKREDSRDALLSFKYPDINSLPKGAVVGTSSLRRKMQISALRPDIVIKDLRGNVDTRITKLKNGEFDAIILASAGINRLGFKKSTKYYYNIPLDTMIPSMGQGALGIEVVNNPKIIEIVSKLADKKSMIETTIERAFVDRLEGGCQVPIGVSASFVSNDTLNVRVIVGLPDGSEVLQDTKVIKQQEFKTIGTTLANEFIDRGAQELLKRAETMASNMNSTL